MHRREWDLCCPCLERTSYNIQWTGATEYRIFLRLRGRIDNPQIPIRQRFSKHFLFCRCGFLVRCQPYSQLYPRISDCSWLCKKPGISMEFGDFLNSACTKGNSPLLEPRSRHGAELSSLSESRSCDSNSRAKLSWLLDSWAREIPNSRPVWTPAILYKRSSRKQNASPKPPAALGLESLACVVQVWYANSAPSSSGFRS